MTGGRSGRHYDIPRYAGKRKEDGRCGKRVPTHTQLAHISSMIPFCNGRRQKLRPGHSEALFRVGAEIFSNTDMARLTGGVSMTVGWKPPEVASEARLLEWIIDS
jgi:hypothetical protein